MYKLVWYLAEAVDYPRLKSDLSGHFNLKLEGPSHRNKILHIYSSNSTTYLVDYYGSQDQMSRMIAVTYDRIHNTGECSRVNSDFNLFDL